MQVTRAGQWTVLIYTSASRDLETAVTDSLHEITDSFSSRPFSTNVVAQMGQQDQARRMDLSCAEPQIVEQLPDLDMTEPANLQDFVRWGMQRYPARHYAVVLGGHGAGFAGAVTDSQRRDMMRLPEIRAALEALPQRPDLVVFNTCLMAQAEVAAELSGVTPVVIGSQGQLRGLGLPLGPWLQGLHTFNNPAAAGADLVAHAAEVPERAPAVAALELSSWPDCQAALDGLAAQILSHPLARPAMRAHIAAQEAPWPRPGDRPLSDLLDVRRICQAWRNDPLLPAGVREHAQAVLDRLAEVVSAASEEQWGGLSVLAPSQGLEQLGPLPATLYGQLKWSQRTAWDEAIASLGFKPREV